MSEEFPSIDGPEASSAPPAPATRRIGWQVWPLGVGLLLAILAGAFSLIFEPPTPIGPIDIAYSESQTYTEGIVGQPQWVNPLLAVSQADRDLASLIYSGLTRVDEYGQPSPDLADSWTISPDGLTYTFHLRAGVVWHDGAPFTADDVAFTMSLLRDPSFPGPAGLGAFWQTVETYADDPSTVRFVLTQPLAAFPEYARIGILPVHALGGIAAADLPADPFNLVPIGTGRLRWVSSQKQLAYTSVELAPVSAFYDPPRAIHLSAVEFRFYQNANSAFSALSRSETQAMGDLTLAQLASALPSQRLSVYSAREPIYGAILFNQAAPARLPFFTDPVIRRALGMALDKQALVAQALPQQALPTESTILPGLWAYDPALTPAVTDVAGAGQLMDQTGWPLSGATRAHDNIPLAFSLLVADNPADRQIGQAVVQAWKAIGVDAKLEVISPGQLVKRLQTSAGDQGRDFDAALVELGQGGYADPDPYPFWHETQAKDGQNYSGFVDRDISELLETARREPNGVRRAELYQSFQQRFLEIVPAIILYNPIYHYAVSCQVQGIQMLILADPSDRFKNMHQWRVLAPEQAAQACPG